MDKPGINAIAVSVLVGLCFLVLVVFARNYDAQQQQLTPPAPIVQPLDPVKPETDTGSAPGTTAPTLPPQTSDAGCANGQCPTSGGGTYRRVLFGRRR